MKKIFVCLALTAVLFSSCTTDVDDSLEIIIDNQSEHTLLNVQFKGASIPTVAPYSTAPLDVVLDGKVGRGRLILTYLQNGTMVTCQTEEMIIVAEGQRKITFTNETKTVTVTPNTGGTDTTPPPTYIPPTETPPISTPETPEAGGISFVGTVWKSQGGSYTTTFTFLSESTVRYHYSGSYTSYTRDYVYNPPLLTIGSMYVLYVSGDTMTDTEDSTVYQKQSY